MLSLLPIHIFALSVFRGSAKHQQHQHLLQGLARAFGWNNTNDYETELFRPLILDTPIRLHPQMIAAEVFRASVLRGNVPALEILQAAITLIEVLELVSIYLHYVEF